MANNSDPKVALGDAVGVIKFHATEMQKSLKAKAPSREDWLKRMAEIEDAMKVIRATMITQTRQSGKGIKANGQPDMRFLKNRDRFLANGNNGHVDLRYNQKP
jgi:hypothetical protein